MQWMLTRGWAEEERNTVPWRLLGKLDCVVDLSPKQKKKYSSDTIIIHVRSTAERPLVLDRNAHTHARALAHTQTHTRSHTHTHVFVEGLIAVAKVDVASAPHVEVVEDLAYVPVGALNDAVEHNRVQLQPYSAIQHDKVNMRARLCVCVCVSPAFLLFTKRSVVWMVSEGGGRVAHPL